MKIEEKKIESISEQKKIILEETPKKETLTTSKPLKVVRHSEFSIQNFSNQKEKKEENLVEHIEEDLPENHFTEMDLQREWNNFLKELSVTNTVVYNAVSSFKINKKEEDWIEVCYSSETAKKEFEEIEGKFFGDFRRRVNNFKFRITYKMAENVRVEVLTTRRKFEKMAEKNPMLKELNALMMFDLS